MAIKVVLLCGGQGTRLREETEYRPKPLIEIGSRPILWHIMKQYQSHGFSDFILCLGYKGEMIKQYFLNYEAMTNDFTIALGTQASIRYHGAHGEQGFSVTLVDTGGEAMTGNRIKRIEQHVDDATFMVTYGDGVSNVNIRELLEFHKSHGRIATLTAVRPLSRFGMLTFGTRDDVVDFAEKPTMDNWANAGFFVFNREVFNYLSADPNCVLEGEPLRRLAQDRQLMAYRHEGFFFAMDTYREYVHLNQIWSSGKAPWKTW
jgi:glucose-1-phosphate cytidylyltransferase